MSLTFLHENHQQLPGHIAARIRSIAITQTSLRTNRVTGTCMGTKCIGHHRAPSSEGPYYIIHLYPGRRREGDFQEWMEYYLKEGEHHNIFALSIDTAVDPAMNIHSKLFGSSSWM